MGQTHYIPRNLFRGVKLKRFLKWMEPDIYRQTDRPDFSLVRFCMNKNRFSE